MPITLSPRALCALADVQRLIPGYVFDAATNDALTDAINETSDDAHADSGREFVPINTGSEARPFDISRYAQRHRTLRIGDCASITLVTIQRLDGTVLETISSANRISLPRVRQAWEPIRELCFPTYDVAAPSSSFTAGRVVAVTGVWGFPAIPDRLRVAAAKLALYRYMTDVASGSDTALAEAAEELNLAGMFANANKIIAKLSDAGFA